MHRASAYDGAWALCASINVNGLKDGMFLPVKQNWVRVCLEVNGIVPLPFIITVVEESCTHIFLENGHELTSTKLRFSLGMLWSFQLKWLTLDPGHLTVYKWSQGSNNAHMYKWSKGSNSAHMYKWSKGSNSAHMRALFSLQCRAYTLAVAENV